MTPLPRTMIAASRPYALFLLLASCPLLQAEEVPQGLVITACTVFSEQDKSIAHDCASEARKLCPGPGTCELPIGMNLTAGKDLDDNPDSWELVRVDFKCKDIAHLNGPHYQNDHATMTLACQK